MTTIKTTYVLEWMDGRTSEIIADSDSIAIGEACDLVGEDAVHADEWDQAGQNDDGLTNWRLLLWANESAAENDSGAKAVAQLTVCCADRPVA